ncbi:hypothetical protein B0T10DRAFT_555292 [Thelonectria olida]|uniref:Uncharacterized protein n=1 Tax=Thelonectria olida TaxID=1576542 RepID=A0A9P8WJG5_9HYPO|nr:hypothetical protein B0T10DRAFT_555292 [Thelonectria olida]
MRHTSLPMRLAPAKQRLLDPVRGHDRSSIASEKRAPPTGEVMNTSPVRVDVRDKSATSSRCSHLQSPQDSIPTCSYDDSGVGGIAAAGDPCDTRTWEGYFTKLDSDFSFLPVTERIKKTTAFLVSESIIPRSWAWETKCYHLLCLACEGELDLPLAVRFKTIFAAYYGDNVSSFNIFNKDCLHEQDEGRRIVLRVCWLLAKMTTPKGEPDDRVDIELLNKWVASILEEREWKNAMYPVDDSVYGDELRSAASEAWHKTQMFHKLNANNAP